MRDEIVQAPFRCPVDLLRRFDQIIAQRRPHSSRNAMLVFLVEQWVLQQEKTND